jgi:hypothetical protein
LEGWGLVVARDGIEPPMVVVGNRVEKSRSFAVLRMTISIGVVSRDTNSEASGGGGQRRDRTADAGLFRAALYH